LAYRKLELIKQEMLNYLVNEEIRNLNNVKEVNKLSCHVNQYQTDENSVKLNHNYL
jgi:hypothetical protein